MDVVHDPKVDAIGALAVAMEARPDVARRLRAIYGERVATDCIDTAVLAAAARYGEARVLRFLPILIEREARRELDAPAHGRCSAGRCRAGRRSA
jgi:hypothetical protein